MEYNSYLEIIDCSKFLKILGKNNLTNKDDIKSFVEHIISKMVKDETYEYESQDYRSYKAIGFINRKEKKNDLIELTYYPDTKTIFSNKFSIHIENENENDNYIISYNNDDNDLQYIQYNKNEFLIINYDFIYENNEIAIQHQHYSKSLSLKIKRYNDIVCDIINTAGYDKQPLLENNYLIYNSDIKFKYNKEDNIISAIKNDSNYRYNKDFFSIFENIFFKNDKVIKIELNKKELKDYFKEIERAHEIILNDIIIENILSVDDYNKFINTIEEKLELYTLLDDKKIKIKLVQIADIENLHKGIKKYEQVKEIAYSLTKPISNSIYGVENTVFSNGFFVNTYMIENLSNEQSVKYDKIAVNTISNLIEETKRNETLNIINETSNEISIENEVQKTNKTTIKEKIK